VGSDALAGHRGGKRKRWGDLSGGQIVQEILSTRGQEGKWGKSPRGAVLLGFPFWGGGGWGGGGGGGGGGRKEGRGEGEKQRVKGGGGRSGKREKRRDG